MNSNIEQIDLQKLDKIFPSLHDFGEFDISIVIPSHIKFDDGKLSLSIPAEIRVSELLKKYGYAKTATTKHPTYSAYLVELTDKGREAKYVGGHFAYLKKLADKEQKEQQRQHRADEISKFDLLTKKFFYKVRLWPFIVSTCALVVSLLVYFN